MRHIKSSLSIGPLSSEIIEATFQYSESNNTQLMLIASKNQIDHSGGYVNDWNTTDYSAHINLFKIKYPKSDVIICRDHCGPHFNGISDIEDSYKTVECDIQNDFDLIHFDFCHIDKNKRYKETKKLIQHALSIKNDLIIEIGTDENTGKFEICQKELESDIEFFLTFCNPEFYVVQTGSLVSGISQAGKLDVEKTKINSDIIHSFGLKLKEHNADYLSIEDIRLRSGIVDSMNIAPQLGVVQTLYVVTQAKIFGFDPNPFLAKCYNSNKWNKWFETGADKFLCAISCGHYNFTSEEYVNLCKSLNNVFNLKDSIILEISKIINLYVEGMGNESSQ